MPDDHSEVVPLLPIPNRTVKRLCADDSADSRVKVGHRQALTAQKAQQQCWAFCFFRLQLCFKRSHVGCALAASMLRRGLPGHAFCNAGLVPDACTRAKSPRGRRYPALGLKRGGL